MHRRPDARAISGIRAVTSGEHASSRTSLRPSAERRSGSAKIQSKRSPGRCRYSSAEVWTTSMLAAWSRRKFSAAIRASVSLRSSVTTRRKRRLRKSASTPSPQVRSSAVSPSIRLCAAHASLDACSKASGGSMHCAAAYDGSFDAARARYLTCVATSRAWGTVRSRATSSGSRPRETAMARCTSSVSSSSYSSGVIMRANVRFFSVRRTMRQPLRARKRGKRPPSPLRRGRIPPLRRTDPP